MREFVIVREENREKYRKTQIECRFEEEGRLVVCGGCGAVVVQSPGGLVSCLRERLVAWVS